jgi:hypothetical protein
MHFLGGFMKHLRNTLLARAMFVGLVWAISFDFFASDSHAQTWQQVTNLPSSAEPKDVVFDGAQTEYLLSDTVYLSSDGGSTWTPFNQGLPASTAGKPVHLVISKNGTLVLGFNTANPLNDGSYLYYRPKSASSWTLASINNGGTQPTYGTYGLAVDSNNRIYAATGWDSIYISDPISDGSSFTPVYIGSASLSVFVDTNDNAYFGTEISGELVTSDGGQTFTVLSNSDTTLAGNAFAIITNARGDVIAGTCVDSDRGNAAATIFSAPVGVNGPYQTSFGIGGYETLRSLFRTPNGDIYAGTWTSGVYVSHNGGNSDWQPFSDGLPLSKAFFFLKRGPDGRLYTGPGPNGAMYRTVLPVQ